MTREAPRSVIPGRSEAEGKGTQSRNVNGPWVPSPALRAAGDDMGRDNIGVSWLT